jgi:hypothetical protein
VTDKDKELKLLDYARKATVHAELAATCKNDLVKVSRDGGRNARNDIREAIEHLQSLERALDEYLSA